MNSVNVIGTLTGPPWLRRNRAGIIECRMRIAVPRHGGKVPEPGVVYLDVSAFGNFAHECSEKLKEGSRIGLSGRLEVDEHRTHEGVWDAAHGVLIDQLDFLDAPPLTPPPKRRRRSR